MSEICLKTVRYLSENCQIQKYVRNVSVGIKNCVRNVTDFTNVTEKYHTQIWNSVRNVSELCELTVFWYILQIWGNNFWNHYRLKLSRNCQFSIVLTLLSCWRWRNVGESDDLAPFSSDAGTSITYVQNLQGFYQRQSLAQPCSPQGLGCPVMTSHTLEIRALRVHRASYPSL